MVLLRGLSSRKKYILVVYRMKNMEPCVRHRLFGVFCMPLNLNFIKALGFCLGAFVVVSLLFLVLFCSGFAFGCFVYYAQVLTKETRHSTEGGLITV